jgi:hypothetical protein
MMDVGLLLLRAWQRCRWCWMSYRSNSWPRIGSWIVGKAQSLRGKMAWWLPSMPLGELAWNATPSAHKPSRSGWINWPRHVPLCLALRILLTSVGCSRSAKSSFPYKRRTWRCRRQSWQRNRRFAGCYTIGTFPCSRRWFKRSWRQLATFWNVCERSMPLVSVRRTETMADCRPLALGHLACHFLLLLLERL